ncbi:hypothetical protein BDV96DRAFT_652495 [Lophiotrema nucula]|uniref:Fucose-specific lectin n=1 Tax=Lophiotrema nucula TaxID=690887 RepID=A0A6A5YPH4_9PLEO|nr:hypothetical protein BDV96DRAFT_652495 [Lophiotrema nucula]
MDKKTGYSDLEVVRDPRRDLENGHGIEVDQDRMQVVREEDRKRPYEFAEQDYYAPPQYVASVKEKEQVQEKQRILGLKRRTFWILLGVAIFVVIAAAVGGGVGGALANRNKDKKNEQTPLENPNIPSTASPRNKTSPVYQNSSLAAVQWVDQEDVNHYHVFYQYKDKRIVESAWNSTSNGWTVSNVTDDGTDVKLGTGVSATGGYPNKNTSWPGGFVKDVFYATSSGKAFERQSPYKSQVGVWGSDNFSGQFSAANLSSFATYWQQDLVKQSQVFGVLFQDLGANHLNIAKFADGPWEVKGHSISMGDGSPIAVSHTGGDAFDLRLYLGDSDGKLVQYEYDLGSSDISNPQTTAFDLPPQTPLCVSTQNYTSSFKGNTLPDCADNTPNTQLILFATPDRSGLTLVSWNCSSGFLDQTSDIKSLAKSDRTYVGLSSHSDGSVYVMFDGGDGPEMEEWTVPKRAGSGGWQLRGTVPINTTIPATGQSGR